MICIPPGKALVPVEASGLRTCEECFLCGKEECDYFDCFWGQNKFVIYKMVNFQMGGELWKTVK